MMDRVAFIPLGGAIFLYSNGLALMVAPIEEYGSEAEHERVVEMRRTQPAGVLPPVVATRVTVGVVCRVGAVCVQIASWFVPDTCMNDPDDPDFTGSATIGVADLPALMGAVADSSNSISFASAAAGIRDEFPLRPDGLDTQVMPMDGAPLAAIRFRSRTVASFQLDFANGMTLSVVPYAWMDALAPDEIVSCTLSPAPDLPPVVTEQVEIAAFETDVYARGNWLTGLVVPEEDRDGQQIAVIAADDLLVVMQNVASLPASGAPGSV